jgi:hypothetical protein
MIQFPAPCPSDCTPPPLSSFEQFVVCLVLSGYAATFIFLTLPRPLFCKLFRIAFPFLPERLGDEDDKD